MNDENARKISDALDSEGGLRGDPEVARLLEDPELAEYAKHLSRMRKWMTAWPLDLPSDDEFDAMASRIESELGQRFSGDFTRAPIFDDEDAEPREGSPRRRSAFPPAPSPALPGVAAARGVAARIGRSPAPFVPRPSSRAPAPEPENAANAANAASTARAAFPRPGARPMPAAKTPAAKMPLRPAPLRRLDKPTAKVEASPDPDPKPAASVEVPEAVEIAEAVDFARTFIDRPAFPRLEGAPFEGGSGEASADEEAAPVDDEPIEVVDAVETVETVIEVDGEADHEVDVDDLAAMSSEAKDDPEDLPIEDRASLVSLDEERISLIPLNEPLPPPVQVATPPQLRAVPSLEAKPAAPPKPRPAPAKAASAAPKAVAKEEDRFSIPMPSPSAPLELDLHAPAPAKVARAADRRGAAWGLWLGIAAVLAVGVGLAGYSDFFRTSRPIDERSAAAAPSSTPAGAAASASVSAASPGPGLEAAADEAEAEPPRPEAEGSIAPLADEVPAAMAAAMERSGGDHDLGASLAEEQGRLDRAEPSSVSERPRSMREPRAASASTGRGLVPAWDQPNAPPNRASVSSGRSSAAGGGEEAAEAGRAQPSASTSASASGPPAAPAPVAPAPTAAARSAEREAAPVPSGPVRATLDRETVQAVMQGMEPAVRACAADRHGTAQIDVVVQASGRVSTATVTGAFQGTPEGSCMARALRSARFPPFTDAPLRFRYPFAL